MILKIEKAVYGGAGMAFPEGKAVFVRLALPGDIAEVKITSEKSGYSEAEIVSLAQESPIRQNPPCPSFGACGGCSYLNTAYENELEIKKFIAIESIRRTGGLASESIPGPELISGPRFHYRSHASVKSEGGRSGFFAAKTNELVPLPPEGCLLLHDNINAALKGTLPAEDFSIATDCRGQVFIKSVKTAENIIIEEIEKDIIYRRGIEIFFQSNRFLRGVMLEKVAEFAGLREGESFLDIGCGCGFFSLFLARRGSPGRGIDISRESIKWARRNAKLNSISGAEFAALSDSDLNPHRHSPDVIVLDPPRAGLSGKARKTIADSAPEKIVYVSCNPATFSRDLKFFTAAGYSLERLALIDMFPGTHHIELLSLLTRT